MSYLRLTGYEQRMIYVAASSQVDNGFIDAPVHLSSDLSEKTCNPEANTHRLARYRSWIDSVPNYLVGI